MSDPATSPDHYTSGGMEARDALRAAMGGVRHMAPRACGHGESGPEITSMAYFWWGNSFKYLWRWPCKGGLEDLRKARQCIDFLIDEMEAER